MGDLSSASDFEQAWSLSDGQIGRYDGFSFGHSMLIIGSVDNQTNYQIHDPNVFEEEEIDWYLGGNPKGRNRLYNADEVWATVHGYAGGFGIAVAPPAKPSFTLTGSAQASAGISKMLVDPAGETLEL